VIVSALALLCLAWGDPLADKTRQALKLYKQKKYDETLSRLADAQTHDPENAALRFNIGDAHYRKGKFKDAQDAFQEALDTSDLVLEAKAYYNIGNCAYRQGKLTESLGYYKQTIELLTPGKDSADFGPEAAKTREDAQYNHELVQKKIKEMLNKQKKRQQEQKKGDQKDQQQQQKRDKSASKDEQQKQRPDQQKQQTPKPDKQQTKQGEQPQPTPAQRKPMTKEEAERLLEALKREEDQLRKRMRRRTGGDMRADKDW